MILHDEKFIIKAKELISNAKYSIYISTFKAQISDKTCDRKHKEFFTILKQKATEGIKIHFLINWHDERRCVPASNDYTIKFCKENNIKIKKLKSNRCCHAKILIVDLKKLIIGSHNLSIKSCADNFEMSIDVNDDIDVKDAISIYEKVWQDAVKL